MRATEREKLRRKARTERQRFETALGKAISNHQSIALQIGQVIWFYIWVEKWVRIKIELPSSESACLRADNLNDEGCLVLQTEDANAVLHLDKALHAEVSLVKMGFVLCGHDNKEEPAICACAHVLGGASVVSYLAPVPYLGEFGQAYCAKCVENADDEHDAHDYIVCFHCYQKRLKTDVAASITATSAASA